MILIVILGTIYGELSRARTHLRTHLHAFARILRILRVPWYIFLCPEESVLSGPIGPLFAAGTTGISLPPNICVFDA